VKPGIIWSGFGGSGFNISHCVYPEFGQKEARRATFICASYDETLAMLQAGDVVYCDPPYDGTFTAYHTAGFNEDDQYHLASILEHRSSEGHPVVVSNSDTLLTRSLYRNFLLHSITTKRSMGVDAGERKSAEEIIAVSRVLRSRRTHSILARVCPGIDEARA
ncbi:MAG: DNA adenine methylase, partial [Enterobacter asburiae]|nr:DNA adenine methylase [Enterobacter asburiae]